jgi:ribosomal protein S18 acetylase RimI-like enzyme
MRPAIANDLWAIAQVHKNAYSRTHFTALLPERVLMRYYGAFLGGGTEIRVACDSAQDRAEMMLGFSVHGEGIPEKIAAFKKACATDIAFAALRHPLLSSRKAFKVVAGRLATVAPCKPADFLLLSIAVAKPARGIGGVLLDEAIAAARQSGHRLLGLYVNQDNVRAINAYFRAGFRIKEFRNEQYYMECEFEV